MTAELTTRAKTRATALAIVTAGAAVGAGRLGRSSTASCAARTAFRILFASALLPAVARRRSSCGGSPRPTARAHDAIARAAARRDPAASCAAGSRSSWASRRPSGRSRVPRAGSRSSTWRTPEAARLDVSTVVVTLSAIPGIARAPLGPMARGHAGAPRSPWPSASSRRRGRASTPTRAAARRSSSATSLGVFAGGVFGPGGRRDRDRAVPRGRARVGGRVDRGRRGARGHRRPRDLRPGRRRHGLVRWGVAAAFLPGLAGPLVPARPARDQGRRRSPEGAHHDRGGHRAVVARASVGDGAAVERRRRGRARRGGRAGCGGASRPRRAPGRLAPAAEHAPRDEPPAVEVAAEDRGLAVGPTRSSRSARELAVLAERAVREVRAVQREAPRAARVACSSVRSTSAPPREVAGEVGELEDVVVGRTGRRVTMPMHHSPRSTPARRRRGARRAAAASGALRVEEQPAVARRAAPSAAASSPARCRRSRGAPTPSAYGARGRAGARGDLARRGRRRRSARTPGGTARRRRGRRRRPTTSLGRPQPSTPACTLYVATRSGAGTGAPYDGAATARRGRLGAMSEISTDLGRRVWWVDAFIGEGARGNPAVVVLARERARDGALPADRRRSSSVAETAFLRRHRDGWELRCFTPTVEVDLFGHASLAALHVLFAELGVGRARGRALDEGRSPIAGRREGRQPRDRAAAPRGRPGARRGLRARARPRRAGMDDRGGRRRRAPRLLRRAVRARPRRRRDVLGARLARGRRRRGRHRLRTSRSGSSRRGSGSERTPRRVGRCARSHRSGTSAPARSGSSPARSRRAAACWRPPSSTTTSR